MQEVLDQFEAELTDLAIKHGFASVVCLTTQVDLKNQSSGIGAIYIGNHYASLGAMQDEMTKQNEIARSTARMDGQTRFGE